MTGKKKCTTEYLHNRFYLQFLERKEKEKDHIGDKTRGIQRGREGGVNVTHRQGDGEAQGLLWNAELRKVQKQWSMSSTHHAG